MFFTSFIAERGPPWRPCDIWDELYSNISDQLKQESQDHGKLKKKIYYSLLIILIEI